MTIALRLSTLVLPFLVAIAAPAGAGDAPGCRDHPALSRMPGFHLDDCEEREFDAYDFRGPGGEELRGRSSTTWTSQAGGPRPWSRP